ncbi:ABC transporter permease [Streptomyces sp. NBC_00258]|uniref:ABC transporter permease n=1 Tax=Streptomyces sp. NBC_00258 TaxID=2903642 RepID=UPI002E2821D6|nr:ABC transporter permease [Streptomyces sp. NBC_00258]
MALGLGPAALIAALSVSLVAQYRGSGVINLATGSIATFGAFLYYSLRTDGSIFMPFPFPPHRIGLGGPWAPVPAFLTTIVACMALGAALDLFLFRPLRTASPLAKLMVSLGVFLTLQSVFAMRFGPTGLAAPAIFPNGPDDSLTLFGVPVPTDRFFVAGLVAVVAVMLICVYRFTGFGLATRAASESETNAMLIGINPQRLSLYNTTIAATLAGTFGVIVAPTTQLDTTTISLAVVPALGAALLAGFTSFGVAAAAGIAMGIVGSVVTYVQTLSWFPTTSGTAMPGVESVVYLAVIVGALLWRGAKLPSRGTLSEQRLPAAPEARRLTVPTLVSAVLGVGAIMVFTFDLRQATVNSLLGVIICLSLVVIVGFVGQVSLVHVALAGVAAFAISKLALHAGIGLPLAPILAIGVAVIFGLAAAIPALRVRGVNLAIVTLAAAVAIEQFVFSNPTLGQDPSNSPVPSPRLFGLDLGPRAGFPGWDGKLPSPLVGLEVLAITLVVGLFVANLRRSTLGRQMLAVRSNERAAAAAGISVRNVKIAAFAISSAIAGLAGVLAAYNLGSVSASRWGLITALGFVAFAYMGGITTTFGAVNAGLMVPGGLIAVLLQNWTGLSTNALLWIGGVSLVLTVIYYPQGVALYTMDSIERILGRFRPRRAGASPVSTTSSHEGADAAAMGVTRNVS